MDGYRYWVERHKLLVELEEKKALFRGLSDAERTARTLEVEREFRSLLDRLYAEARQSFEPQAG
jgi:hypothetical protein